MPPTLPTARGACSAQWRRAAQRGTRPEAGDAVPRQCLGFRRKHGRRATARRTSAAVRTMARLAERARKRVSPARAARRAAFPRKQASCTGADERAPTGDPPSQTRAVAMAQQLCLRGALRPVTRRGSVAVRARAALPPRLLAAAPPGSTPRAAAPRPTCGCRLRDHRAAKPAAPLLRRRPISLPCSQAPAPAFVGLRAMPMASPASQVRARSDVALAALACRASCRLARLPHAA